MELAALVSLVGVITFAVALFFTGLWHVMRSNKRQRARWAAYLAEVEALKWRPDFYDLSLVFSKVVVGAAAPLRKNQNLGSTSSQQADWKPICAFQGSPQEISTMVLVVLPTPGPQQVTSPENFVANHALGVTSVTLNKATILHTS